MKWLLLTSLCVAVTLTASGFTTEEVTKDAREYTDWLLKSTGDRDLDLNRPGVYFYGNAILDIRWVTRGELLQRKNYLDHWSEKVKRVGFEHSEQESGLVIWNTGEATDAVDAATLIPMQNNALTEERMWRVLLSTEQLQKMYKLILETLPASATANQPLTDNSICLIIQYAKNSRMRERHYYLPGITYANGILAQLVEQGSECPRYLAHRSDALGAQKWTVDQHIFVPDSSDQ